MASAAVGLFALGMAVGRSRSSLAEGSAEADPPGRAGELASVAPAAIKSSATSGEVPSGTNLAAAVDQPIAGSSDPSREDAPLVALVIDDLGRSLEPLHRLAALGVPVSFAVLPFESQTEEVVAWLTREGHEMLVHLPMQAQGAADPGPGALYTNLGAGRLRERTKRALDAVPGAVGVNNHMGSAFTADPAKMQPVLQEIARRRLFFLDSRTSGRSVGFDMALELGMPSARRSVFLDNLPEVDAISRQFDEVLEVAAAKGSAIAIGHPYPSTLETLELRVPQARERGFRFVPVSFLLERSSVPGG